MYADGGIVTLAVDKEHFDGMDTLKLKTGTCGMIARREKRVTNGNHLYIVDFGAYGQWHCTHNELSGDDPEGWDADLRPERSSPIDELRIRMADGTEEPYPAIRFRPPTGVPEPVWTLNSDDSEFEPEINVEADIKRKMAEIEKGNY